MSHTNIVPSEFDGWLKADPDEPTFTLMARDRRAPGMVKQWAYERERDIATGRKPESDRPMIKEARKIAKAMEEWYNEHRAEKDVISRDAQADAGDNSAAPEE